MVLHRMGYQAAKSRVEILINTAKKEIRAL
jgi:hypothetical protein